MRERVTRQGELGVRVQVRDGLLPMSSIERLYSVGWQLIERSQVDVDSAGMGAGDVERVNPAGTAEVMLGGVRSECVGEKRGRIGCELEVGPVDDDVQKALQAADRAIAVQDHQRLG